MNCQKCGTEMCQRAKGNPQIKIQVYVCPKCGSIVLVDANGEETWETK